MADPPSTDDTGVEPDREPATGVPRWVKIGIIILVVLVLLLITLTLTDVHDPQPGPGHGP